MIGPVEISDAIGKTQALERVQQSDKIAENASQKQAHAAVEDSHKKALKEAPPTGKDEDVQNSLRDEKKKNRKGKKRKRRKKTVDKDEKRMTNLGHTIDILG